jgi:hypothetical protein
MQAVSWGGQYSLARLLLDEGADHMMYAARTNRRLVHVVLQRGRTLQEMVPQEKADYEELLARLVDRGESLDTAREDIARWESWSRTTGEYQRKMDAEIAERKAREQADAAMLPE